MYFYVVSKENIYSQGIPTMLHFQIPAAGNSPGQLGHLVATSAGTGLCHHELGHGSPTYTAVAIAASLVNTKLFLILQGTLQWSTEALPNSFYSFLVSTTWFRKDDKSETYPIQPSVQRATPIIS